VGKASGELGGPESWCWTTRTRKESWARVPTGSARSKKKKGTGVGPRQAT
jgi:hypothetical protein